MRLVDEQLSKLEALDVAPTRRPDFDAFWAEALARVRDVPLDVRGGRVDHPFAGCEVRDVTFAGLDGTRVAAWVMLPPRPAGRPLPAVVSFHGASGSRGSPASHAAWLLAGAAVVAMDYRMQEGLTGSATGFVGGRQLNWAAFGLTGPRDCYFYHVLTDALRSVRLARETAGVDPARVGVAGGSQGGGTALQAAALDPAVALCMADVPSSCWYEKRVYERTGGAAQIADFLRAHPEVLASVEATLSYFDNVNLAERIRCPTLVSCGLKDPTCPPDTVYAAYNRIRAPKEMCAYPFGDHGGGGQVHTERRLEFLRRHLFPA